jgi:hypothetical protein
MILPLLDEILHQSLVPDIKTINAAHLQEFVQLMKGFHQDGGQSKEVGNTGKSKTQAIEKLLNDNKEVF